MENINETLTWEQKELNRQEILKKKLNEDYLSTVYKSKHTINLGSGFKVTPNYVKGNNTINLSK